MTSKSEAEAIAALYGCTLAKAPLGEEEDRWALVLPPANFVFQKPDGMLTGDIWSIRFNSITVEDFWSEIISNIQSWKLVPFG